MAADAEAERVGGTKLALAVGVLVVAVREIVGEIRAARAVGIPAVEEAEKVVMRGAPLRTNANRAPSALAAVTAACAAVSPVAKLSRYRRDLSLQKDIRGL